MKKGCMPGVRKGRGELAQDISDARELGILVEEMRGACSEAGTAILGVREVGDCDEQDFGVRRMNGAKHIEPATPVELKVKYHRVRPCLEDALNRIRRLGRFAGDCGADVRNHFGKPFAYRSGILDHVHVHFSRCVVHDASIVRTVSGRYRRVLKTTVGGG